MGRVKEIMMEFEEVSSIIDSLLTLIREIECVENESTVNKLIYLKSLVKDSYNNISLSVRNLEVFRISELLRDTYQQLIELTENCSLLNENGNCSKNEMVRLSNMERFKGDSKHSLCGEIEELLFRLNRQLDVCIREIAGEKSPKIFSSEDFYINQISEANLKIKEAREQQETLLKNLKELEEGSSNKDQEIESTKKELREVADQLSYARVTLMKYKKEKEDRERQEKAVLDWNGKITTIFEDLEVYINPIKNEHRNLRWLFYGYNALSIAVIIFLGIMECCIFCKIKENQGLPTFDNYLALIIPIPIAIGLLWGFITQANRAQLQMVVLAKQIHQITYTEGLLKAINRLSVDLNESTNKINDAIDRLLNKHLKDKSSENEWGDCVKNDPKVIPYDVLIKLIKEIKDVVK